MENYQNTALSPEERADDLLSKLSVQEKMAQTVSIYPTGIMMRRDSSEIYRNDCRYGMGSVSCMGALRNGRRSYGRRVDRKS